VNIATILGFVAGNWQRMLVYGLLILGALGTAAGWGYHRGVIKLYEYQAEQAKATVAVVIKIEKVKGDVRDRWHKGETVIVTQYQIIEKENTDVPSRPECNVTAGWMRGHDNAAAGRRDAGALDDTADTGITEAQTLGVVTQNYKAYGQVANDLTACRGFVAGVAKATE
jgi:hypothetical protein